MKFDRFLAKLFSRAGIFVLLLLLVFSLFCMGACNDCDVFLCLFCGCVTPETCFEACDCACDCSLNCASESCVSCVEGTSEMAEGCACVDVSCLSECFTDEEGNPIDCEDVGCPECQSCFDCDACFSGESSSSSSSGGGYATDEEFYEWLDRNGY